ncbi:MAG TPA: YkvA family protein [Micromonosporaceae bacterium]|jgi:uncharacterized membrane protein YkvA (DUF1232 family)
MSASLRRRTALIALFRAFNPATPGIGRRITALPRLVKASVTGRYDGGLRLVLMAAAAIYVVSPIDAIPELFLAIFGLIDDAFVVTWLIGTLMAETERFLEWEKAQGRGPSVIVAEVLKP